MSASPLSSTARASDLPLVVDLDGTLLRSDLLIETFVAALARRPLAALRALAALARGKAALKSRLAQETVLDIARLPWHAGLLHRLRLEREAGRKIYLASASNRTLVDAVAAELGLFDGVFASDERTNLKGPEKAALLRREFGPGGFDYVGNESADFAVWADAARVIVAGGSPGLVRAVKRRWPDADLIETEPGGAADYLKALRPHQWLKNLLLFVPVLAAHETAAGVWGTTLLAFVSFCLCASSAYCLNDLIDVGRDRSHPTKRARPLAAGRIPLLGAFWLCLASLAGSLALATLVGPPFAAALAAYGVSTVAYSLWLKRLMMIDVVTLGCLYGLRLVAGSAAALVPLSSWLAAFALFLFCSLAIVKRLTELISRSADGQIEESGRGYSLQDLPVLQALAAASGFTAILVLALYLNSPAVAALYQTPDRLWLLCVVLIYWIGRVLILTHRGEMHDDPVVFAATDRASLICCALATAIVLASL